MKLDVIAHALCACALAWCTQAAAARSLTEIQQEGTVRIGVNPNFPFNSYYGPSNQLEGFDIDVGRQLAKALGVEPVFVPTETALRIPFLASGRIDISLGALTRSPERDKLVDFTIPVHTEAMGVLTTDKLTIRSWRELNDPRVRLVNMRGNYSVPFVREKLPRAQLLLVDGNADTIRSIAQGRADALVENIAFFMAFTKAYPEIRWRVLTDPIEVAYCAAGVSQGNHGLRQALNQVLADLHGSGYINERWSKWYGAPMLGTIDVDAELAAAAGVPSRATVDAVAGRVSIGSTQMESGESSNPGYQFDFAPVLAELPYLLKGAGLTLLIAFVAFWVGAVIGLFGALGKTYGHSALRKAISAYVIFVTNTPALVQVFFLFYGLPAFGILLSPLHAVLIGLAMNSAAYLTEILRGGVVSVRPTEVEAAEVLGFSRSQTVRHVVLPHVIKTVYGPMANFFIILVLGSSLAVLFGVEELTGRAVNISTTNLRTIETFSVVALIYVALTVIASTVLAQVGRMVFKVKMRSFA